MLNVIYHKTFKETGRKECICDEDYHQRLDYIEWFNSPDLVDRRKVIEKLKKISVDGEPMVTAYEREEKILDDLHVVYEKDELEKKKRGRPKVKKE